MASQVQVNDELLRKLNAAAALLSKVNFSGGQVHLDVAPTISTTKKTGKADATLKYSHFDQTHKQQKNSPPRPPASDWGRATRVFGSKSQKSPADAVTRRADGGRRITSSSRGGSGFDAGLPPNAHVDTKSSSPSPRSDCKSQGTSQYSVRASPTSARARRDTGNEADQRQSTCLPKTASNCRPPLEADALPSVAHSFHTSAALNSDAHSTAVLDFRAANGISGDLSYASASFWGRGDQQPNDVMIAKLITTLADNALGNPASMLQHLLGFANEDYSDLLLALSESGCSYVDILAAYLYNMRVVAEDTAGDVAVSGALLKGISDSYGDLLRSLLPGISSLGGTPSPADGLQKLLGSTQYNQLKSSLQSLAASQAKAAQGPSLTQVLDHMTRQTSGCAASNSTPFNSNFLQQLNLHHSEPSGSFSAADIDFALNFARQQVGDGQQIGDGTTLGALSLFPADHGNAGNPFQDSQFLQPKYSDGPVYAGRDLAPNLTTVMSCPVSTAHLDALHGLRSTSDPVGDHVKQLLHHKMLKEQFSTGFVDPGTCFGYQMAGLPSVSSAISTSVGPDVQPWNYWL